MAVQTAKVSTDRGVPWFRVGTLIASVFVNQAVSYSIYSWIIHKPPQTVCLSGNVAEHNGGPANHMICTPFQLMKNKVISHNCIMGLNEPYRIQSGHVMGGPGVAWFVACLSQRVCVCDCEYCF